MKVLQYFMNGASTQYILDKKENHNNFVTVTWF